MHLPLLLLVFILGLNAEFSNFDYKHHGDDWNETNPSWTQCASQKQQSPIQITAAATTTNDSYLFTTFKEEKASITYLNTTIYIKTPSSLLYFGQVYTMTIEGHTGAYKATQVRLRSHSEHKINGQYYDLEVQIFCLELYGSPKNQKLAFSLMFEVGDTPDPALQKIINNYNPDPTKVVSTTLDFSHMLNNAQTFDYWTYLGSTTIPPCYSGILNWVVSKRVHSMSQQQRDFVYGLFNNDKISGNWRNLQPLKENPLSFFHYALTQ